VNDLRAVAFDAFGTLIRTRSGAADSFRVTLETLGYAVTEHVMGALQAAAEGLEHRDRSGTRDAYMAWAESTSQRLRRGDPLDGDVAQAVIPCLEELHQVPMAAFDDAQTAIDRVVGTGLRVAVCSNFGWDLRDALDSAELRVPADASVVSSAEAGARKPHPKIYLHVAEKLECSPSQVAFVGDSYRCDVEGPREVGMRSVWLARNAGHPASQPPDEAAAQNLHEALDLLGVAASGET
jgi:putative hydrolase of the HAD superfamily